MSVLVLVEAEKAISNSRRQPISFELHVANPVPMICGELMRFLHDGKKTVYIKDNGEKDSYSQAPRLILAFQGLAE